MSKVKKGLIVTFVLLVLLVGYGVSLLYSESPVLPTLDGDWLYEEQVYEGISRGYLVFKPLNLPANAPAIFMLHGSLQDIADIRKFSGYEFERLASQHGFLLIYPQGFKNNWNDCRARASYPAKKQNIDDVGFILSLIEHVTEQYAIDPNKVAVAGFSNGGHLGFRLASEHPSRISAVAAISANLPHPSNFDCQPLTQAVPILVMNGTDDPINPYSGGIVTLFGFGNRGKVLSSVETAQTFATLAGYDDAAIKQGGNNQNLFAYHNGISTVTWRASDKPEITLYSIKNGGHVVPQPYYQAPRILGATNQQFNGPLAIWQFFDRQWQSNR